MSAEEVHDVVDDKDRVVGVLSRSDVYRKGLAHRIVHVLVYDITGRVALQKRADVKYYPHTWVHTAGGHVQAGETYAEAALRELEEEAGVTLPITPIRKDLHDCENLVAGGRIPKWIAVFRAEHDGPFDPDPDAVEEIRFFDEKELKQLLKGTDVHPELRLFFEGPRKD